MKRLAGWGSRLLRYVGKIAELLAWIGFVIGSRATVSEFPEFWSETRRGWLKGVRGWYRSTILTTPLLAPIVSRIIAEIRESNFPALGAIVAAVSIFGAASAIIAPIAVHGIRALAVPRPLYDIAATGGTTGALGLCLVLAGGPAPVWLVIWPWFVGALWGWLYWFFSFRPRPPYASGDR